MRACNRGRTLSHTHTHTHIQTHTNERTKYVDENAMRKRKPIEWVTGPRWWSLYYGRHSCVYDGGLTRIKEKQGNKRLKITI